MYKVLGRTGHGALFRLPQMQVLALAASLGIRETLRLGVALSSRLSFLGLPPPHTHTHSLNPAR